MMEQSRKKAIKDLKDAMAKKYPFKTTKSKRSKRKAKKTYPTALEIRIKEKQVESKEKRKIQDIVIGAIAERELGYNPDLDVSNDFEYKLGGTNRKMVSNNVAAIRTTVTPYTYDKSSKRVDHMEYWESYYKNKYGIEMPDSLYDSINDAVELHHKSISAVCEEFGI